MYILINKLGLIDFKCKQNSGLFYILYYLYIYYNIY